MIRKTWLFLMMAGAAAANSIVFDPLPANQTYQQNKANPCIIGSPACKQPAGFDYTLLQPNDDSYDVDSPVYTVGQIRRLVGNNLLVGIYVNQSNSPQYLGSFTILVNGSAVDSYSVDAPGISLDTSLRTSVGTANYLLSNLTDLSPYQDSDQIQFHVFMTQSGAGRDQFFLIAPDSPAPEQTPEPATFVLTGLSLLVLAVLLRRRTVRA